MSELQARVRNYLGNGGLFNPELMEHGKVRDLIIDCRDEIERLTAEGKIKDEALAFFKSVIQSGEVWTDICQRTYDAAVSGRGSS